MQTGLSGTGVAACRRLFGVALLALALTGATSTGPARAHSQAISQAISNEPAFRIVDFDWVDVARSRPVPARLYWPQNLGPQNLGPNDLAPDARVPLIVFSHGMGGSRRGYSYLARYWAARGVASLHVQHVGSDTSVWIGNPLTLVQRLQKAAHESEALARGMDVRFALDRVLSRDVGSYAAQIDRQRIVVAGHSYGANTALVAVGCRRDARRQADGSEGYALRGSDRDFLAAVLRGAAACTGAVRMSRSRPCM